MDHSAIKEILPHRHPVLLVDRVLDVVPGQRLTALKAVTGSEPWYGGLAEGPETDHAYPPVLLIESWCQAAGILVAWKDRNPDVLTGDVMLFGGISNARFHRPVHPGDVLEHHVSLVRSMSGAAICEGDSTVAGTVVLEIGRVVMARRPAELLRAPAARAGST